MFLESSRSKFIGYTLGRWVPAELSWGTVGVGVLWQRLLVWGLLLPSNWQAQGFSAASSSGWWSLTCPWGGWLMIAPVCNQLSFFPSLQ